MKRLSTVYGCDLCSYTTDEEKKIIPYSISWIGVHNNSKPVVIERHYCPECHASLQTILVKTHKEED